MTTPGSAKPKAFRRAHVWLALVIAVSLGAAVAGAVVLTRFGRTLELKVSDSLRTAAALPDETLAPSPAPITIFGIDDPALNQFGRWPWPRTRLAAIIDLLRELGARLIVLDIEFPERESPRLVEETGPDGKPVKRWEETDPQFVRTIGRRQDIIIPFSVYLQDRPDAAAAGGTDPAATALASKDFENADRLKRFAVNLAPHPSVNLRRAANLQPMIPEIAQTCAASGYTSILHDPEDGVIRRIPLLIQGGGKVFPHMMLAVTAFWRFGPRFQVRLQGDRFYILSADGTESVSVPVGERAQVELRWPTGLSALNIRPITPVISAVEHRAQYRSIMAQLDNLFPEEGWAAACKTLDDARAGGLAAQSGAPTPETITELEAKLALCEEHLAMNLAAAASDPPTSADEKSQRLKALAQEPLKFIEGYQDPSAGIKGRLAKLKPHVDSRICFIGYYATGIADLHTTAIGNAQPGVTVYPPGIRTLLSGVAFWHLGPWLEWLLGVLATAIAAAATVRLSTWRGVAATVLFSGAIVAAAWAASAKAALLLPVAGPVLAVVVGFAGVSVYRQLTEASSRRWITRVFQQYSSAELLDEILRNPDVLRLGGERRDITFLFSDIAGFTTLSEKFQPEQLVALLNHYLSVMTDIILAERAKLDKYEGDAILALFGAPVPTADHAVRAVRAALAMQAALPKVNQELVEKNLLPPDTVLAQRIGCSTGPAIVGNFGSEQRFDYTAMGDTVNLGSRMEEANRWMKSRILVPEATRSACGGTILFRPFGTARIRGKTQPIRIYEPLAVEPAPPDLKTIADAFNRMVDALAARDLPSAEAALREVLALRPDDGPALAFQARIEAIRAGEMAPDEPWNFAQPK